MQAKVILICQYGNCAFMEKLLKFPSFTPTFWQIFMIVLWSKHLQNILVSRGDISEKPSSAEDD